jgi:hypothetical protein
MMGLAQFLIGREKSLWKEVQRRRGELDMKEAESPGERPRLEIRNAIWSEATEEDGEFRIAEGE